MTTNNLQSPNKRTLMYYRGHTQITDEDKIDLENMRNL